MQIKGLQIFLSELARKKNGVLFPLCTVLSSKAVSCVSMLDCSGLMGQKRNSLTSGYFRFYLK